MTEMMPVIDINTQPTVTVTEQPEQVVQAEAVEQPSEPTTEPTEEPMVEEAMVEDSFQPVKETELSAPEVSPEETEASVNEQTFEDDVSENSTADSTPSHRVIWPLFKDIDYADPNMPLSPKASTRLRQMLARPGIVVSCILFYLIFP